MATPFTDDDADLALVQDRNVAFLGYDDQARAQALCLRDSGVDVRVGVEDVSADWTAAAGEGLRVVLPGEACEEADLVVVTARTQEGQPPLAAVLAATLVPGDAVVLGPLVALDHVSRDDTALAGVDVVRVVPWADGATVRAEFEQGRGVAMFTAVVEDATGSAWDLALSYARAVGATRAGVIRTADDEYAKARLFTETTLFRDGVLPLIRSGLDTLVASGVQPEVAYLLCVHGLTDFADAIRSGILDAELTSAAAAEPAAATGRDPSASDDTRGTESKLDPILGAAALVRSLTSWSTTSSRGLH